MNRRDVKGRTMANIVRCGASLEHYLYLQNGNRVRAALDPAVLSRVSTGTTANEATHGHLKAQQREIVQEHANHTESRLEIFSLSKQVLHNIAEYHPTASQRSAGELLSLASGHAINRAFSAFGASAVAPVVSVSAMKAPVLDWDISKHKRRQVVRESQQEMWARHTLAMQRKKHKSAVKFLSVKKLFKRTAFTRRKQAKVRRVKDVGGA